MRPHHCFATLLLLAAATAQDMIAVGFSGQIHGLDSFTGAVTTIGSGLPGQNAAARDDHGRIWSTSGSTLTVLDPTAPNATIPLPGLNIDLRGLANAGAQYLWGIENGTPDLLVRVDKVTGATTVVGPTGFGELEALEQFDYRLYAWDLTHGLVRLDMQTGAGTDINPALGGGAATIAWLSTRADGAVVGGKDSLYRIDTTTGATTLLANLGGIDLRGADAWQAFTRPYGTGCAGAGGIVTMTGSITGSGLLSVALQSSNHAPGAIGALVIGISNRSSHLGALPFPLDPVLGTAGCTLYTSIDASLLFNLVNDVYTFFAQHVTLEAVAGGLAFGNGVIVQLGR